MHVKSHDGIGIRKSGGGIDNHFGISTCGIVSPETTFNVEVCLHACIVCVCMCVCMRVCVCESMSVLCVGMYVCVCVCVCVCARVMCVRVHVCVCVCVRVCGERVALQWFSVGLAVSSFTLSYYC